jgi:hypothetical protein
MGYRTLSNEETEVGGGDSPEVAVTGPLHGDTIERQ